MHVVVMALLANDRLLTERTIPHIVSSEWMIQSIDSTKRKKSGGILLQVLTITDAHHVCA